MNCIKKASFAVMKIYFLLCVFDCSDATGKCYFAFAFNSSSADKFCGYINIILIIIIDPRECCQVTMDETCNTTCIEVRVMYVAGDCSKHSSVAGPLFYAE